MVEALDSSSSNPPNLIKTQFYSNVLLTKWIINWKRGRKSKFLLWHIINWLICDLVINLWWTTCSLTLLYLHITKFCKKAQKCMKISYQEVHYLKLVFSFFVCQSHFIYTFTAVTCNLKISGNWGEINLESNNWYVVFLYWKWCNFFT